ncbi:MAG: hypothetical protein R3D34_17735 [Nitratireductor sp.]
MRGTLLTLLALGTIWAGLPSQETISVTASTTTQQQHDTKTKWLVSGTVDCMVDLDQGATTQPSIIMSGSCSDAPRSCSMRGHGRLKPPMRLPCWTTLAARSCDSVRMNKAG